MEILCIREHSIISLNMLKIYFDMIYKIPFIMLSIDSSSFESSEFICVLVYVAIYFVVSEITLKNKSSTWRTHILLQLSK